MVLAISNITSKASFKHICAVALGDFVSRMSICDLATCEYLR